MKLLSFNGSPRLGSSTQILVEQFTKGFQSIRPESEVTTVRLNDLDIIPCQACGLDPTPEPCIFQDDLYRYLNQLFTADMVLIASPIYFDSVSAQTKLLIDRTNCMRPPQVKDGNVSFNDHGRLNAKGAYILVGGEREKFEHAERVIGGMFVWSGIEKIGRMVCGNSHDDLGTASNDRDALDEAFALGVSCVNRLQASN